MAPVAVSPDGSPVQRKTIVVVGLGMVGIGKFLTDEEDQT